MNKDLISVIVCIYNREKYLDKCITSITNQTYKNLEIILIDDGSTDKSLDICKKYQKEDKRIKVHHQKNKGIAYTRNVGLSLAKGKYLCFCDSDDYYDVNYCQYLYDNLKENNADFSMCDILQHTPSKNYLIAEERNSFTAQGEEMFDYLFSERRLGNPINKLYKSEIIKSCKYPINTINEDTYIIYDILSKCQKFSYLNLPLYNRVIHTNSIMSTNNIDRLDEIGAFEHWAEEFKKKNDNFHYEKSILRVMDSIMHCYSILTNILDKKQKQELLDKFNNCRKKITINISVKNKLKYFIFRLNPNLYSYIKRRNI